MEKEESKDGADARGWKRGKNRDGVNVAFIEDAQNDVNGDEGGKDEDRFVRKGVEEGRGCALKSRLDAGRHVQFLLGFVDGVDGVAESSVRSEVEGNSNDGRLALMIEGKSGGARFDAREGAEWNLLARGGADVNIS